MKALTVEDVSMIFTVPGGGTGTCTPKHKSQT